MPGVPALKILYVEDHAEAREAVERLLRHNGHHVRGAAGVSEALAAAAKERFDLLVADISLPDGNGCDLLLQLRRSQPTIRGVAVTGHDQDDLMEGCRAAGFSDFLLKPVSFSLLLAAVDRRAASPGG
jgi:CheY-like chemotaxis protein